MCLNINNIKTFLTKIPPFSQDSNLIRKTIVLTVFLVVFEPGSMVRGAIVGQTAVVVVGVL